MYTHTHTHQVCLGMLKLLYLFLGLFRAEIRCFCKWGSSTNDDEHAYYFFLKYIYSYQLFSSYPQIALNHCQYLISSLSLRGKKKCCPGGGWKSDAAHVLFIAISFGAFNSLCLPTLPAAPSCPSPTPGDCLASSPKRKCVK